MKERQKSRILRRIKSSKSGATAIEMGLLLPLLLLLMGGMAEFGRAFQQFHLANKGVKSAARYLSRVATGIDCASTAGDWAAKTEVALAKNLAVSGSFSASSPSVISNWAATDITIPAPSASTCFDNSGNTYLGDDLIPIIRVTTSFEFNDIGLLSFLGVGKTTGSGKKLTIRASHEEMYIGG